MYLISCTLSGRQYTGTMVNRFRERFTQYKSNVNLYSQGILGLTQEKMIFHCFYFDHIGSTDDMHVQIIDHCNPNDKKEENHFRLKHSKQCIHMD